MINLKNHNPNFSHLINSIPLAVFLMALLLSLTSCQLTPQLNNTDATQATSLNKNHAPTSSGNAWINQLQLQNGLTTKIHRSAQFSHLVITNQSYQQAITHGMNNAHSPLYIFIEGDGQAWVRNKIKQDPTSKKPLLLNIMKDTSHAALYLGRPCYYQNVTKENTRHCHPNYWTQLRYSQEIIDSLIHVLFQQALGRFQQLVFIGHSGGGSLALLIAESIDKMHKKKDIHFSKKIFVITLAGNIDIDAWASHHEYTPLIGSINPRSLPDLGNINQLHFLAALDKKIPPKIVLPTLKKFALHYHTIADIDHTCCWHTYWTTIDKAIQSLIIHHSKKP